MLIWSLEDQMTNLLSASNDPFTGQVKNSGRDVLGWSEGNTGR